MSAPSITPPDGVSALATAIAGVRARNEYLPEMLVGIPDDPAWVSVAEVFGPDRALLDGLMTAARAEYESDRADFGGMSVMGQYSWVLTALVIGAYGSDQLIPDLSLDNVAIRRSEQGGGDAIAFRTGAITAVAGSSAASDPLATVVPADALTLDDVRQQIEAHFAPIVSAIQGAAPLGKRALWLVVADMSANALVRDGEAGAESETLVTAFCQQPGSPLKGGTKVLTIHHTGEDHRFIQRGSCCLYYKVGEHTNCTMCPLRKQADRIERLTAYLDSLAAEPVAASAD